MTLYIYLQYVETIFIFQFKENLRFKENFLVAYATFNIIYLTY